MEITGRDIRQISLVSLLILIAPMILFPDCLGLGLAKVSLVSIICELIYYAVVAYFFFRRASLPRIVQAAGVYLVYRLLLGAIFGLLIATMYSMNLTVSLTIGMSSYLPAILLQIAATPFILKPITARLVPSWERWYHPVREPIATEAPGHGRTAVAVSTAREAGRPTSVPPSERKVYQSRETHTNSPSAPRSAEANGFDQAARYIGEDNSVQLAVVVDHEGLLLGHFQRGEIEVEDWAPFSLVFCEVNKTILQRVGWEAPEKIDLSVKDTRIIVTRQGSWYLMVIASRQGGEFLNIRINQGQEMIRKYIARRYGPKLSVNAEKIHVSSA